MVGNDTNFDGGLPDIIAAAYRGDHETVRKLLEAGESVNALDSRDNLSLLHIACMQGDKEIVGIVLERDRLCGDVDFGIKSQYRPRLAWQYAMNAHHYEIAHAVHEAGMVKLNGGMPLPSPD